MPPMPMGMPMPSHDSLMEDASLTNLLLAWYYAGSMMMHMRTAIEGDWICGVQRAHLISLAFALAPASGYYTGKHQAMKGLAGGPPPMPPMPGFAQQQPQMMHSLQQQQPQQQQQDGSQQAAAAPNGQNAGVKRKHQ